MLTSRWVGVLAAVAFLDAPVGVLPEASGVHQGQIVLVVLHVSRPL